MHPFSVRLCMIEQLEKPYFSSVLDFQVSFILRYFNCNLYVTKENIIKLY